jgi:hypothetical protein
MTKISAFTTNEALVIFQTLGSIFDTFLFHSQNLRGLKQTRAMVRIEIMSELLPSKYMNSLLLYTPLHNMQLLTGIKARDG